MSTQETVAIEAVANQLGISIEEVYRTFRRLIGHQKAGPPPKTERDALLKSDLALGMSIKDIARKYGLSITRVYQLQRKVHGLCVMCGEPAELNRSRCITHLNYSRDWMRTQAAGGSDA
jgi:transposase